MQFANDKVQKLEISWKIKVNRDQNDPLQSMIQSSLTFFIVFDKA